ncbi:hypothetical protein J8273_7834 [Carpediemonas membranifera]|uniref:Uncharacterized protein n=1 Tax=Carpediemonas membranifera TaxID=201153 RepID=A0A8J6AX27_9EUKA|nr:hypothetical protein J8273_7834 [Carpediemonas membranifera]|eukprot:KAG9390483.1 hypothetical protein J8273_7834 [Carpediemonas membranifera]
MIGSKPKGPGYRKGVIHVDTATLIANGAEYHDSSAPMPEPVQLSEPNPSTPVGRHPPSKMKHIPRSELLQMPGVSEHDMHGEDAQQPK